MGPALRGWPLFTGESEVIHDETNTTWDIERAKLFLLSMAADHRARAAIYERAAKLDEISGDELGLRSLLADQFEAGLNDEEMNDTIGMAQLQRCRVCFCTDFDCEACVEAQGVPCHWVEDDLCSRCELESAAPEVDPE